jgi:hypothetical protein
LKYNRLQTRAVVGDEAPQKQRQNHGKLLVDTSKNRSDRCFVIVILCARVFPEIQTLWSVLYKLNTDSFSIREIKEEITSDKEG